MLPILASVHSEFQREIVDTGRLASFLFFVALLGTFAFIRTSTWMIRKQVRWWPGNVSVGGTHVHHLVWGICAMMIVGYIGGKPVKQVRFVADPVADRLELVADATRVGSHDPVRLMVRALDQAGHKLPFFPEPVAIEVSGAGTLLGPSLVPLRAGSTGFWVQANGTGRIDVSVSNGRLGTSKVELTAG